MTLYVASLLRSAGVQPTIADDGAVARLIRRGFNEPGLPARDYLKAVREACEGLDDWEEFLQEHT